MSVEHAVEQHHDANHDDHDAHDDGVAHSTVAGYVNGFVLSVVLTAIPFALVMSGGVVSSGVTALVILAFAAVQIVVHMVYFLHMNTRSEHGWSILALIFTTVLVVIMLSGSLWVMYHLNTNMMPMSPHEMRNAP
jgi:cytochrome o ubiquinol oxidase subunit IV